MLFVATVFYHCITLFLPVISLVTSQVFELCFLALDNSTSEALILVTLVTGFYSKYILIFWSTCFAFQFPDSIGNSGPIPQVDPFWLHFWDEFGWSFDYKGWWTSKSNTLNRHSSFQFLPVVSCRNSALQCLISIVELQRVPSTYDDNYKKLLVSFMDGVRGLERLSRNKSWQIFLWKSHSKSVKTYPVHCTHRLSIVNSTLFRFLTHFHPVVVQDYSSELGLQGGIFFRVGLRV